MTIQRKLSHQAFLVNTAGPGVQCYEACRRVCSAIKPVVTFAESSLPKDHVWHEEWGHHMCHRNHLSHQVVIAVGSLLQCSQVAAQPLWHGILALLWQLHKRTWLPVATPQRMNNKCLPVAATSPAQTFDRKMRCQCCGNLPSRAEEVVPNND